jgi:hypothetical protein
MSRTHLVIPDQHAHPDFSNERADFLAKLIIDVKPDVVINIGDGADMPSLASYDKGKRSFYGKSYKKDIDAWLDFQDRLWAPVKAQKKKMPDRYHLEGNHEERIERALDLSPELQGTIGFSDLRLDDYNNEVVRYHGDTPGILKVDGVAYAHYFISGIMGRSVSGEHPAYTLLSKNFRSCTQGHAHTLDFCERTDVDGSKVMGMVCGVFQDYDSPWAGHRNDLWWRGVVIKHNVAGGVYDPEFISLDRLKKSYGVK